MSNLGTIKICKNISKLQLYDLILRIQIPKVFILLHFPLKDLNIVFVDPVVMTFGFSYHFGAFHLLRTHLGGVGGGGQHLCIQMHSRGEGGSEHDQKYAFCTEVY